MVERMSGGGTPGTNGRSSPETDIEVVLDGGFTGSAPLASDDPGQARRAALGERAAGSAALDEVALRNQIAAELSAQWAPRIAQLEQATLAVSSRAVADARAREHAQKLANAEAATKAAKQTLKAALDDGDPDAIVSAQEALHEAQINQRIIAAQPPPTQRPQYPQGQRPAQAQRQAQPHPPEDPPSVADFKRRNPWYGRNDDPDAAAATAFAYKFDERRQGAPDYGTPDHFKAIEAEVAKRFPHLMRNGNPSVGGSAHGAAQNGRVQVRLTPNQVEFADRYFKGDYERYARRLRQAQESGQLPPLTEDDRRSTIGRRLG